MSERNKQTLYSPKPAGGQVVSFNAVSATAATALSQYATGVRVYADQNVWIELDGTTAAASVAVYLPAGIVEYFPVPTAAETGAVISALGATQSGSLYISELNA